MPYPEALEGAGENFTETGGCTPSIQELYQEELAGKEYFTCELPVRWDEMDVHKRRPVAVPDIFRKKFGLK